METDTMGIVLVSALIENHFDVVSARKGLIPETEIRRSKIAGARVLRYRGHLCLDAPATDRSTGPGSNRRRIHAKTVAGLVVNLGYTVKSN